MYLFQNAVLLQLLVFIFSMNINIQKTIMVYSLSILQQLLVGLCKSELRTSSLLLVSYDNC